MATLAMGLLAGWKRKSAEHYIVLSIQVLESGGGLNQPEVGKVVIAISDQQLCSLSRDLVRAAKERGLEVWPNRREDDPKAGAIDKILGRIFSSRRRPSKRRPGRPLLLPHYVPVDDIAMSA
jgi:hypothetical protein